jgi:hypothetical protein
MIEVINTLTTKVTKKEYTKEEGLRSEAPFSYCLR